MIKLSKAIKEYLNGCKFIDNIKAGTIQSRWEGLFGKEIAQNIRVERYKDQTLYLKCKNSTWRHEAQYLKTEMLEKLSHTQKEKIKKIIIK